MQTRIIKDREFVIQKRFYKDVHYYDEIGVSDSLIKNKSNIWVSNREYGWSEWEDLKGFHHFSAIDAALKSLNKNKHQLKRTVEFRIIKNLDINKATLEIKDLCGVKRNKVSIFPK